MGLASTVASPTVAIDRARMGMVVDMGMGTDRMAGRDEAAKSRDVDERRAAMVAAMITMMDDDDTLFCLFRLFQDLSLFLSSSLSLFSYEGDANSQLKRLKRQKSEEVEKRAKFAILPKIIKPG